MGAYTHVNQLSKYFVRNKQICERSWNDFSGGKKEERIKHTYEQNRNNIKFVFPPKWKAKMPNRVK